MNHLQVEHLQKSYKGRTVVSDVSLYVNKGEVVGLLGPNGAGKTTSFYMIIGLVNADQGKIVLNQKDITHMPMHARARAGIGYLPQETSIFRKLSVRNNLMAILEMRKDLNAKEKKETCHSLLQEFHIAHLSDAIALRLSGGEKRRVEIARALANNPDFILLDEPFAGIDPISVIDIKRIITQLTQRGIGVLITDHNVRDTLDICERAYIVSEGKVIANGPPENILKNQEVRTVYLGHEFDL